MHSIFTLFLQQLTPSEGAIKLFKEILKRTAYKKLIDATSELEKLNKQEEYIVGIRNKAIEASLNGDIKDEHTESFFLDLDNRQQELKSHRAELEEQQQLNEATIEYVLNFIDKPAKLWSDANLESKRALQRLLFPNGLHIDLKAKKCRTEDLSPLYSVVCNKK